MVPFVCFSIMSFLWVVMAGLALLASKMSSKSNRETLSAFECGFDSKHFGRTSFSVNFCVFLILFLVFDIELVFFFHLPMVLVWETSSVIYLFILVAGFIFGGFMYEESGMSWV